MTKTEVFETYMRLDPSVKARFLAVLSHQLTIQMRDDYDESIEVTVRAKRLMGANELQHHLSSELCHHLEQDPNRYPDDVLLNILIEKAHYYELSNELQQALVTAAKRFQT